MAKNRREKAKKNENAKNDRKKEEKAEETSGVGVAPLHSSFPPS